MTIKPIFSACALVLVMSLGFSQTKTEALRDAKLAAQGTLDVNFDEVLEYTFVEVIELIGGKAVAKQTLEQTFSTMKTQQGFSIEKAEILEVSDVVQEQNQYRCIVKSYNEMVMSGQRLKSTSYLLGVFDDTAKHWRFIEAKQLQNKAITNQILPGFETTLELPQDEVKFEAIKD